MDSSVYMGVVVAAGHSKIAYNSEKCCKEYESPVSDTSLYPTKVPSPCNIDENNVASCNMTPPSQNESFPLIVNFFMKILILM